MSDKNYTLAQLARLTPCQHHYTFQIRSDDGSHTNWMNLTRGQFSSVSAVITGVVAATPANHWSGDGEGDPHAGRYDCERAALALGSFTDDELANGAFMNYDQPLDVHAILSKKEGYYSPIAWMTAVKDRIRWLSRSLTACQVLATQRESQALDLQCRLSGLADGARSKALVLASSSPCAGYVDPVSVLNALAKEAQSYLPAHSPAKALQRIQKILSGQEWDSGTASAIAEVMEQAGFSIESCEEEST